MRPEITKTKLPGVLSFQHERFEDHRGTYEELYNAFDYTDAITEAVGEKLVFQEDDIAISHKHVLRGLHGDDRTWKLITCLKGQYYIVVLNYDNDSVHFGEWESFILSDKNRNQLLVPPKHGHGYVVMSEEAVFHYKQTCTYQGMEKQFTITYDDSRFNIWWPIKDPILSRRDSDVLQR